MSLGDGPISCRVNILKPFARSPRLLPTAHKVPHHLPFAFPPTRSLAHTAPANRVLTGLQAPATSPPQGLCTGGLPQFPFLLELFSLICTWLPPMAPMSLFLSCHPLCPFPCFISPHCTPHTLYTCVCVCACLSPRVCLHEGRACPVPCSSQYPNAMDHSRHSRAFGERTHLYQPRSPLLGHVRLCPGSICETGREKPGTQRRRVKQ